MFISITFEIVFSDSIELVKCFGYMYADAYSREAHPFEWTKQILHPGHLKQSYADLCN